jgi:hypothetical protein
MGSLQGRKAATFIHITTAVGWAGGQVTHWWPKTTNAVEFSHKSDGASHLEH